MVQRREQMVQRREQMVQRRESVLWGHRRYVLYYEFPSQYKVKINQFVADQQGINLEISDELSTCEADFIFFTKVKLHLSQGCVLLEPKQVYTYNILSIIF